METDIKVGSVVFHRRPIVSDFKGPGTVLKIEHDDILDVDAFTVLWQSSGVTFDHYKSSLLTLAEKQG